MIGIIYIASRLFVRYIVSIPYRFVIDIIYLTSRLFVRYIVSILYSLRLLVTCWLEGMFRGFVGEDFVVLVHRVVSCIFSLSFERLYGLTSLVPY